ncbi:acyltransferase, partial [Ruminococcaceae bacterium OttesenSCG-928-I18]|nr:acyltransferase [Ruminococcaceae bacterium OttesenSCG-928-I18]
AGMPVGAAMQVVYAFHMPLFFVISGFLARKESLPLAGWGKLLYRKTTGLLVPYVLFALICFYVEGGPWSILADIAYGSRNALYPHSSQLWFLPCLFLSVLLFQLCQNLIGMLPAKAKLPLYLAAGLFLFCAGAWFSAGRIAEIGWPFSLNVAFMGTSFMFLGWGFRFLYEKYLRNQKLLFWLVLCLSLGLGVVSVFLNRAALEEGPFHLVSMATADYGNPLLFYLTAGLLSLAVLLLSTVVNNPVCAFIGRNTLVILCASSLLMAAVYDGLAAAGLREMLTDWRGAETILVTGLVLGLAVPLIYLLNWFAPNLAGKAERNSRP